MDIKAIYEKGVLRPLRGLALKEGEEIEVTVKGSILDEIDRLTKPSKKEVIEESIELSELGEGVE
ncbi:MAG: antitoxin family protein [Euryarchaeota archaeon]|nr:antitoxin family protein [Euryarchaeota archaeon]